MKNINIKRKCYSMASKDEKKAEITLYGDIVEQVLTDWWGDPIDGNYITLDTFLNDLKEIQDCNELTIRINSYGGDTAVGLTIHNKLRELSRNGTKTECIVDGVAMSAGSIIMCACDNVKVNPASLIMIHKCWVYLWGGYNADELRAQADAQDAYDRAIVSTYQRKTGLKEDELLQMMAETTYMTGREAKEKGLADEVLEDAQTPVIAASANGRAIFYNGQKIALTPGMFAPENIPTIKANSGAKAPENNKTVINDEGGIKVTKEELRAQYPDIVAEIEGDARNSVDVDDAVNNAVTAERDRLSGIDAVARLFDAELVNDCKYTNPCTAEQLTLRAAQEAVTKGSKFLNDLIVDNQASGTNNVGSATPPANTDDDPRARGRAAAQAYNQKEGK